MDEDMTDDEVAALIESDLQRALDEPMPPDLARAVRSLIEPHTINMELKHRDVMECIDVAFPVIRGYLLGVDRG